MKLVRSTPPTIIRYPALKMKKIDLYKELDKATSKLLEMARDSCWNKISGNCEFILSEIDKDAEQNFFEERKLRRIQNLDKIPTSLKQAVNELTDIYSNLYDVNLFIFHSMKDKTIVDIRYFLKSTLDVDYQHKIKGNEPMLHCKIGIPPYQINKNDKYDVNWELGGIKNKWKMFLWRIKHKLKI